MSAFKNGYLHQTAQLLKCCDDTDALIFPQQLCHFFNMIISHYVAKYIYFSLAS